MSILSLFAPSLTNSLVGMVIILLGIALFVVSLLFVPFPFKGWLLTIGIGLAIIGLVVMFGFSLLENIFSNLNYAIGFIGIIALIIIYYVTSRR